jgi:hypothetical protein
MLQSIFLKLRLVCYLFFHDSGTAIRHVAPCEIPGEDPERQDPKKLVNAG